MSSIKRRMGTAEKVALGEKASLTPPEVSALILKALRERAEGALGGPVSKAVITVPAYFSDAQRQATREAGEIAGLEVVRLLHEPTAASLAYGARGDEDRTILVYDLGGGTLDVSVVSVRGDVTEVLASHGDTTLGGDDFDELLLRHILDRFPRTAELGIGKDRRAMARLRRAAEGAKKALSAEPYARVREEHIATDPAGIPVHLDLEVARTDYERLIRPLVERSLESIERALKDASKSARDLAEVLLVGGSTRTPLVAEMVEEATGLTPRRELHPELAVALGAGLVAARLAGEEIGRVLVDVTPYTFGVACVGELDGAFTPFKFKPLIARNAPIPVAAADSFYTMVDGQDGWDVEVFQGEHVDVRGNIRIGEFRADGFSRARAGNEILCRMELDQDGILTVTAIEKRTGVRKRMTIAGATKEKDAAARARARERVGKLYGTRAADPVEPTLSPEDTDEDEGMHVVEEATEAPETAEAAEAATACRLEPCVPEGRLEIVRDTMELVARAKGRLPAMDEEDRRDAERHLLAIERAIAGGNFGKVGEEVTELEDLLYYAGAK